MVNGQSNSKSRQAKIKLNTPDTIRETANKMQCYQKDAREFLQHFADVIATHVVNGETVSIKALGQFYLRVTPAGNIKLKFRAGKAIMCKISALREQRGCECENVKQQEAAI